MTFNPQIEREAFLHADGALLRQLLDIGFESYRPMGYTADTVLKKLVYCWLVGLSEEIAPMLPRAIDWLGHAIVNGEGGFDDFAPRRTNLYAARAMARWLLHAEAAEDDWAHARIFHANCHARLAPGARRAALAQEGFDDYLACCVQSGDFEAGLRAVDDRLVPRGGSRRPAVVLVRAPRPLELAYAVCLNRTRGNFGDAELFDAGRRMLDRCLDSNWLACGESLRAAMWLKIVHWDLAARAGHGAASPLQTVLRAHDHLGAAESPAKLT